MENTITQNTNETEPMIPTQKILLWIGLAGIIMFFAALMSGYIVRQAEGNWLVFEIPSMFYVSTVVILLSSITFEIAKKAIKKDDFKKTYQFLTYTLALGFVFVICQLMGWNQLVANNIHFSGGNPSESFFYAMSGLHLAHLSFGVISMLVTTYKAKKNRYSAKNHLGISLCAIYWHFLDFLWLILFVFLALFR
ncbi:MAG: heme-copper oxidase subunit III [Bacteroidota bacterium]|jgi:cytochrome c oxidase subunit 3